MAPRCCKFLGSMGVDFDPAWQLLTCAFLQRQLHQRQPASERWQPFRRRWRGRLDFTTSEWWSFRLFYKQCCPPGWRWRSLWRRSQQARNPGYHRIGRSLRWRCSSRLYTRAATPARFLVVWRRIGSAPAARPATAATTATAGWRSLWRCGAASASFGAVFVVWLSSLSHTLGMLG